MTEKLEYSNKNLYKGHLFHHKSHMDWSKNETGPPLRIRRPTAWALAQPNRELVCHLTELSILSTEYLRRDMGNRETELYTSSNILSGKLGEATSRLHYAADMTINETWYFVPSRFISQSSPFLSTAKAAGVLKKHDDDKIWKTTDGRDVIQSIDKIKLNGGK